MPFKRKAERAFCGKSAIKQGFAELPTKVVDKFVGFLWAAADFANYPWFSPF